jgi:uncharacterized membrane protein YwzB
VGEISFYFDWFFKKKKSELLKFFIILSPLAMLFKSVIAFTILQYIAASSCAVNDYDKVDWYIFDSCHI